MANDARALDPWRHVVTAGPVGLKFNIGEGDERPWYASRANDAVQWHLYGKEYYDPWDLATEMTRRIDETWGFDKPVFCGEFGYGGEDPATHDHTHVGIWSALMSGAGALSHSAPVFQIDSDEPMTPERGRHFAVLAKFLHAMDKWDDPRPRRDVTATPEGTRVWSLRAGDGDRVLWVLGPHVGYGEKVTGARVTVPDLSGAHEVEWIDDVTGASLEKKRVEGGELDVPPFVRHVAARITK
jgi:hypothetical protein